MLLLVTGSKQPPNQPYLAQLEIVVVMVDVVGGLAAEDEIEDDVVLSSCGKMCEQSFHITIKILNVPNIPTNPASCRFRSLSDYL